MTPSVKLFTQSSRCIIVLIDSPALKLRHHQLDEIGEALRSHRVGQVKAVDIGFIDPRL